MPDELATLPSQIPRSRDPMGQIIYDAQMDFVQDKLIPILNKMFTEQDQRTERKMDDLAHAYERDLRASSEINQTLIGSMDKHLREAERSQYEAVHRLDKAAESLSEETRESRSARDQHQRIMLNLEHVTEQIGDKNKSQDESIELLKAKNQDAEIRLQNMEHDIQMLQRHNQTMLETLMGNPSSPGVTNLISEIGQRMERVEKQLIELNKPRGISAVIEWVKRSPTALFILFLFLTFIVMGKP